MKFQLIKKESNEKYKIDVQPDIFVLKSKEAIEI